MADEFELFASGDCDAKLPVNPVVDEFTFVRFARLRQLSTDSFSGLGPSIVLPRDVVHPWLAEKIRKELFYYPPVFVKGGVPLKEAWLSPLGPPQIDHPEDPAEELDIQNLGSFFTDKIVRVGRDSFTVDVTESMAKDLRTTGTTVAGIGEADGRMVVRLHSKPIVAEGGQSETSPIYVGPVDTFLADATILLGGNAQPVQLTESNIRDLDQGGVTQVTIGEGEGAQQVFITSAAPVGWLDGGASNFGGGIGRVGRDAGSIGSTRSMMTGTTYSIDTKQAMKATPLAIAQVNELLNQRFMDTLEFVLYLPYRQTWTLKGYSRGELLNTISLAPEEETTIEVFSWDRFIQTREEDVTVEQESTFELQLADKHSHEIVKELTKDSGWSFNIGGGVTLPAGDIPVDVQAGYDTSASVKDFSRDTRSHLVEAVQRASARFKTTHQTKVTETHEFGSETRTTRKIRNPNMVHALNLDYFEVQATYDVLTTLDVASARLCVLTPQFLTGQIDDPDFMLAQEFALREALLAPSLYGKAFEALHTLKAWDAICDVKCRTHCSCEAVTKPVDGTSQVTGNAGTASQVAQATEMVKKAAQAIRGSIQAIRGGGISLICGLANDVGRWARYSGVNIFNPMSASEAKAYEAEWETAKASYHRWLYAQAMEVAAVRFWHSAADYAGDDDSPEALQRFLATADPSLADLLNLASAQVRLGATVLNTALALVKNKCLVLKPLIDNFGFDNAGLDGAFAQARGAMDAYRQATAITVPEPNLANGQQGGDAVAAAKAVQQATTEWSPKDIAQAKVEVDALRAHLRTNESFYRQAIWKRMDPTDRYVALLAMGDLLDYVDTQVLGFVGSRAALPFRIERDADLATWFDTNVTNNKDLVTATGPVTVTLPTGAVTLEGRLGDCDLGEDFIVEHRKLDLARTSAEVDIAKERLAQEKLETSRRDQRLRQSPPMLDEFVSTPAP